jgi:N-acetyl-anhydromuramoyl-L-alanine amidase
VNEQIRNGWLTSAQACPSPNFSARPPGSVVSLLVVHNISLPPGQFGTGCVQQFFCNQLDSQLDPYFVTIANLQVSAHLLIERDGTLIQFVSLHDRAWHAGASSFEGVRDCNDYSIGVELEGCDDIAYTEAQYQRLAEVSGAMFAHFPALSEQRVVGHQDIAPGRKTDPGRAFDWTYFRSLLKRHLPTNK